MGAWFQSPSVLPLALSSCLVVRCAEVYITHSHAHLVQVHSSLKQSVTTTVTEV